MPSSVASVSSSGLCAKLEDQRAIHLHVEGEIEGVEGATRLADHRSLAVVDLRFLAGPDTPSMRRSDQPSRPNASSCDCYPSG